MKIEVRQAAEADLPAIRNLSRYYIYELNSACGLDVPEDGQYDICHEVAEYWRPRHPDTQDQYRWEDPAWRGFPFALRVDGALAGFALVQRINSSSPWIYRMGQFFVCRTYQRRGVGRRATHRLFDRFAGHWQIETMGANRSAQRFWRRATEGYAPRAEETPYGVTRLYFDTFKTVPDDNQDRPSNER